MLALDQFWRVHSAISTGRRTRFLIWISITCVLIWGSGCDSCFNLLEQIKDLSGVAWTFADKQLHLCRGFSPDLKPWARAISADVSR
jgi:hypothetical protein